MKIMSPDSFHISFQNIGLLANCCWTKILERMSLVLSYAIGHGSTMSQQGLGKSIPKKEPERWTGTSLAIWYVDQAHQDSPSPFVCITAELSLKPQAVVDVQWRPSGPVSEGKQINAWVVGESLSYTIFRFRCPLPISALCKENPFQTLVNCLLFASSNSTSYMHFYCLFVALLSGSDQEPSQLLSAGQEIPSLFSSWHLP